MVTAWWVFEWNFIVKFWVSSLVTVRSRYWPNRMLAKQRTSRVSKATSGAISVSHLKQIKAIYSAYWPEEEFALKRHRNNERKQNPDCSIRSISFAHHLKHTLKKALRDYVPHCGFFSLVAQVHLVALHCDWSPMKSERRVSSVLQVGNFLQLHYLSENGGRWKHLVTLFCHLAAERA